MKKDIEAIYPLSPMQQGMLFHTLLAPQSGEYCQHTTFTLHGRLETTALQRAWQEVVNRHPILRSLFVWEGQEKPLQIVRRQVSIPWELGDWRASSSEEQAEQLAAFLQQERERDFDLKQAPLMRLALFQLSDDAHQFVWTYHHLLLDGWSLPLLFEEIFTCYRAFLSGKNVSLPRPRPYREYIAWLQAQDQSQAETFWREQLQGLTAPTPLRVDRPAANDEEATYCECLVTLPPSLDAGLRALAQQGHLTLNTLIQGAWALLLGRYSGQDEVLFGVTVSGRSAPINGIENMVGLFINTLPLKICLPSEQPLLEWLREIQHSQTQARQFEYSSLVQVQGWSDVPRGRPLFESILVFENYPISSSVRQDEIGLQIQNVKAVERTNYPLTILAVPGPEFTLGISYDTRRFNESVIQRMLAHLQTLLTEMVANPQRRLADIDLMSDSERQRLLVDWNTAAVKVDQSAVPIHALFEAQVDRTPDSLALLAPGANSPQLSYRELDARANQLACHLQSLGIGPEKIVAICLERTPQMAIAMLGVLKAGGAYLPLDPNYPPERLEFMLTDSGAVLLLTQEKVDFQPNDAPVLLLDKDWPVISQRSAARLDNVVNPDNLVYTIYTSGSTGRPKGTLVAHQSLTAQSLAVAADYNLQPEDRVLQFAAISFDVLAEELFPSWLRGSAVVLYPQQATASLAEFGRFLDQHRLTVLNLPAPYWQEWTAALSGAPETLPESLRLVIAGSDRVSAEHLALWQSLVGDRVEWRNAYGLTETTITTTLLSSADTWSGRNIVPIGRPIVNNQVYVLDKQMRPTPVGVPGELHIAGAGLARGYLAQSGQTAVRFIPNPFSVNPGARMYKTGDLARWTEQGQLIFLGRADAQVSIRGFRIEPGEIEAALLEQPNIEEAVVMVRQEDNARSQLVAYLVAQPDNQNGVDASDLRVALRKKLPAYMVPNHLVFLEELPLLPNGKVDRQALPAPDDSHATGQAYIAPRTPLEEVMANIWTDILGVEQVGIEDNFFERGGHSLLATQLVSRLRDAFQVELPMRRLFEAPTVGELAQVIAEMRLTETESATAERRQPPLQPLPESVSDSETLSFAQSRLWFLHQLEPDSPAYNIPMSVRLAGELNRPALEQTLTEIINRHQALRTTFSDNDGQPAQIIHPPITFAFTPGSRENLRFGWQDERLAHPLIDLRPLDAEERQRQATQFVKEEGHRPFNLRQELPIRAALLRLDDQEHILTVVMHHIISDGWSVDVFTQELAALYQAFYLDQPSPLPALPVQYVDYAHWQRRWLAGEVMEKQLAYWKGQLSGVETVLDLPTDRLRPAVQTFRGANHLFTLLPTLVESLKALSHQHGVTLYMTLLAAFQLLLARYSGQDHILVGSPISGRNRTEIEPLIGFFANTLVLHTDLSGNPSFRDLLKRVREATLDAYAHQDLPFEKLVEEIDPQRDMSRSPLFQVMFIMLNLPSKPLKLHNLTLSPASFDFETSKFDLTLAMGETAQGMGGALEYNSDLFNADTIARIVEHFQNLLVAITADPRQKLADLPLLSSIEKTRLLETWNDTTLDAPAIGFHELFEIQALRTPQATAVICGEKSLTYEQLDRQANQLAHYLQKQGVELETPVGIFLERSPEMMVALLAVLKAGGSYLPLDPIYPDERLAYMITDAGISLVLTQTSLQAMLSGSTIPNSVNMLCLETIQAAVQSEPDFKPPSKAKAHNVAYVIYTSGSTGRPKGVQVLHQGVSNFLTTMLQQPGLTATDRLLAVTTLSFDIAVLELFLPLAAGGQVVIADRETAQDGRKLAKAIIDHAITAMQATPATWQMLLESGWADCDRLKILCGGEALPPDLAARLLEKGASLWNMYGPTETTIWSATNQIETADETMSIGRPIGNTQIYLLDSHLRPIPIGVTGELYIGGDGVARGYWNRPELTAERFIPNPFSRQPNSRLYRSGDLARYLPDGRIVCLGRVDNQVKVRGYRIELGEIEAALESQTAVNQAVVIAREDVPGDKRLVAYIIPAADWKTQLSGQEMEIKQLDQWRTVWNETYQHTNGHTNGHQDPTFNTIGWKSAYTGQPIPAQEMAEWVEQTVIRLCSLSHRRVLEIGCGLGLLLFRLADQTDDYWATDFSEAALHHIQAQLANRKLSHVNLLHQEADEFEKIKSQTFDLVVLNSVVQYFPSINYLTAVLEQSLQATASGGSIFIGDVRSLPLQEAFQAGLQEREGTADLSLADLRQKIQHGLSAEPELLLDPAFFYALKSRFPQISHVQTLLKRGKRDNELTKFRYDVVLHVGEKELFQVAPDWRNWQEGQLSLSDVRQLLAEDRPETFGLSQITNARLQAENAFLAQLNEASESIAVGLDPEDLWTLGDELDYAVEITWSDSGANGRFDALFIRQTGDEENKVGLFPLQSRAEASIRPWAAYATNPLQVRARQALVPDLRRALASTLPEYMLPAAYVILDAFPLTPNGKADRRALPPPDSARTQVEQRFVGPRTPLEAELVGIWSQVLGIDRVGIQDNFFELGGHSLLVTQVIARVRDAFNVEIPLRALFETPTITGLAEKIMAQEIQETDKALLAELLAALA